MQFYAILCNRLIGKVAADHSHKWIYKEPNDQEINFLSAWHNSADSHPRTWEAQFLSGIKTIALIAVREGVVQLGAVHKVIEDLSYVVLLRKKFSYIESIPGVLLPHPSSSAYPYGVPTEQWHNFQQHQQHGDQIYDHFMNNNNNNMPMKVTPSMSSLEALLSKLPSVVPPQQHQQHQTQQHVLAPLEFMGGMPKVAKEELDEEEQEEVYRPEQLDVGESSSSMSGYHHHQQHQHHFHQNINNGF
ncbi:hypothetical protein KIW84_023211 [Lathyrus oleraceus]|uniref:Transcription factor MYC/MYB N-terminal domain-containing protein n=1 Tax=Pisum sativum TaxID=3888 RepID=A0A9D5BBK8_PEA|nr:hypothetical protein KIW84_023211 [Pisum sativum]